jgi:hemerythrin-like metal-binding protein
VERFGHRVRVLATVKVVHLYPEHETWAPSPVRVGLAEMIEGHHRGLKALLLRLEDLTVSFAGRPPGPVVAAVLADLRYLAEMHFAQEEKLMDDIGYPNFRAHADEHQRFLGMLSRFEAEKIGRQTVELSAAWWTKHALYDDRQLTDFLCLGGELRDEADT